jgi:3-hydroxyisobutyrate dehydrogenase-like beta-hydroxyacid dehydrogenase
MTTVGFIGSGAIGSTIARLAVEAGHQVVLSNSRGPETLADTAAELGPRAFAATSGEAAAAGDIVVITVPVKAFRTSRTGSSGFCYRALAAEIGGSCQRARLPHGGGIRVDGGGYLMPLRP